jgi:hypothetical protein
MTAKDHLLEFYDLDGYTGPNPLRATGIGTVRGPEGSEYYVLKPAEAITVGDQTVNQLAVRPHYKGDRIDRAVNSICTVGIALAKPGTAYEIGRQYGFADFCFWTVGKIHPVESEG